MSNNDLTANNQTFKATYQNGKYGFKIDGAFYEIGGGGMPILDFANPLHTFDNPSPAQTGHGLTFTAAKKCYLFGTAQGNGIGVSINNTKVLLSASNVYSVVCPCTKLNAGDVVTADMAAVALHVFDVIS